MVTLRANRIIHEALQTLIVVESVDFQSSQRDMVLQAYGYIKPIAVIVCQQDKVDVFDIGEKPIDLEQLIQDTPGLEALLAKSCWK